MNERIKELAEQATLKWAEEVSGGVQEMEFFDKEKFAELLLKECVKVAIFKDSGIVATADVAGHMAAGRSIAARMINEHFGVEETSIKIGSRVKVISGFNVGAKGTVSYIEPLGKMWVMRDGASTDVFYHPEEVVRIEE